MKIMRPKMVYYACTKYCINFQHISGFQRNQWLLVKDLRSRELNKQSIPLQFSPRRKEKKKKKNGIGGETFLSYWWKLDFSPVMAHETQQCMFNTKPTIRFPCNFPQAYSQWGHRIRQCGAGKQELLLETVEGWGK